MNREPSLRDQLDAFDTPSERLTFLAEEINRHAHGILDSATANLDLDTPLLHSGLDSLSALELHQNFEVRLGVQLPLATFLKGGSPLGMAEAGLKSLELGSNAATTLTGMASDRVEGAAFPLSQNQRALWYLYKLAPESSAYHICFAAVVHTPLDMPRLHSAIEVLAGRHPMLRVSFSTVDEEPCQRILREGQLDLHTIEAVDWDDEGLSQYLIAEAHRPFDLESQSPFRIRLLKRAEDRYVFQFTAHRIAADFRSFWVLMDELSRAYLHQDLPKQPRFQYADFVDFQRREMDGVRGAENWEWWRRKLAGDLPDLGLATDKPRPQLQTFQGKALPFKLPEAVSRGLRRLAHDSGTTLYTVLLTAFKILLHRYSGRDDLLLGSPTAGRTRAEFRDIVGYFANPIVLRTRASGRPGFRTFLERVRACVLESLGHADFPFPLLVERLAPGRQANRSPVFQAMFAIERPYRLLQAAAFANVEAGARLELGELSLESEYIPPRGAWFDLALTVTDPGDRVSGGRLSANFRYNSDLFEANTIERMGWHFQNLVAGIVANAMCRIDMLPLMGADEQARLLHGLNAVGLEFPRFDDVAAMFERRVLKHPDAPALQCGEEVFSYREMDARANVIAAGLIKAGLQQEDFVGVLAVQGPLPLVGMLAVLKAGGVCLFLDMERPGDQFSHMLTDSGLGMLLAEDPGMAPRGSRVIPLQLERKLTPMDWVAPKRQIAHVNAAMISYDFDGSSGPRAALITHSNMINCAFTCANRYGLEGGSRLFYSGRVDYRAVVDAVFPTWLSGACLVLRPPGGEMKRQTFIQHIDEEEIDALVLPTSDWSDWVARLAAGELTLPQRLRLVVAGRERVFPERLEQWRLDSGPLVSWLNLYAMDEVSGAAAVFHDRGMPLAENLAVIPLGRPLENTQAHILNRSGDPVPAGVPGELYLSGLGLARGFYNQPALTALCFTPDPFSNEAGGRLYRTGDLARYLPNGLIAFMGRIADQVRVRGLHLQHSEIEAVIDGLIVGRHNRKPDAAPHYHEQVILQAWRDLLGREDLDAHDDFFEAGGNSLLLVRAMNRLRSLFDIDIPLSAMLRYATVHTLADYLKTRLAGRFTGRAGSSQPSRQDRRRSDDIAVIGMACRFPGAPDLAAFQALLNEGGTWADCRHSPNAVLKIEDFDAGFFQVGEQEARVADPQLRLFLETAWHALEHAGLAPGTDPPRIGVFAAADPSAYLIHHLLPNAALTANYGVERLLDLNRTDAIAANTAYRFNLRGPALMVQAGRTSGLAAVHRACESISAGECDAAIAGAVSIPLATNTGMPTQSQGGVFNTDSARAPHLGGVGVVVLKRLLDTAPVGANVLAVIKGSAMNHDGSARSEFNTPTAHGLFEAAAEALAAGAVGADSIAHVETSCVGDSGRDAVEISALNRIFAQVPDRGARRLGSVAGNIGDAGAAAGMAGLIKTILSLQHTKRLACPGFVKPHPDLEFKNGPFHVQALTEDFERLDPGTPLRAAVASVAPHGNAFVVLQEPPLPPSWYQEDQPQLLTLSAADPKALETLSGRVADYLEEHPNVRLCDVCNTLQVGRASLPYRRMLIASESQEAAQALCALQPGVVHDSRTAADNTPVLFMFPGQGAQYAGMGLELYRYEPVYRQLVDTAAEYLKPLIGLDLRRVLYPTSSGVEKAEAKLTNTLVTQCAVFVVSYACARLWMSRGVIPRAMIGHSIGEYTAACLADVLSLEDTLSLIVERGLLMREVPAGAMLSVRMTESQVTPYLGDRLSLAAVNDEASCVVSGPVRAIDALEVQLQRDGFQGKRLRVSHGFHSKMQDPFLPLFRKKVAALPFGRPKIPYISGVTGDWITSEQVLDPEYWVQHLRRTVRFHQGMQTFLKIPRALLLEAGPGRSISFLAKHHLGKKSERMLLASMSRKPYEGHEAVSLETLGKLWLHGVPVVWEGVQMDKDRRLLPLPGYPFQSIRYWVDRQG